MEHPALADRSLVKSLVDLPVIIALSDHRVSGISGNYRRGPRSGRDGMLGTRRASLSVSCIATGPGRRRPQQGCPLPAITAGVGLCQDSTLKCECVELCAAFWTGSFFTSQRQVAWERILFLRNVLKVNFPNVTNKPEFPHTFC